MTVSVAVEDLSVGYDEEDVLRSANLAIGAGEFHVLLGASGCGKTTLLRAVAGFERARRGRIRFAERIVEDAHHPRQRIPSEKRGVGIVFQDYALFPHLSVLGNVAFGAGDGSRVRARARAEAALAQVGLLACKDVMPDALSGGQQQRVALARALAADPQLLLLDEPFSNLDPGRRAELRAATRAVVRERGVTALMVTHDASEAMELADALSVMEAGRILQTGTPAMIYAEPVSITVARAVGEVQVLPARVAADGRSATCALGRVGLTRAGTQGDLLLRPEMLVVTASGEGVAATIEERRFAGADVFLRLVLTTGERLVARMRPWEVPVQNDVRVSLRGPTVLLPPSAS